MPEPDAAPSREGQYGSNIECTARQNCRCGDHDQELGERGDRRSAETVYRDHKNPQHHRSEAVESTAHDGCRTEVGIGKGEREHDPKAGEYETEACQDTAPPPSTKIPHNVGRHLCHPHIRCGAQDVLDVTARQCGYPWCALPIHL